MTEWPERFLTWLHLYFKTSNLHPIKTVVTINRIQLSEKQLTFYQGSQIMINWRIKNTQDWMTHILPKPDQNQNQNIKKHLRLNNSQPTKARSESESKYQKKNFRLNNSHTTKARSESELKYYQKTLETEQLTAYQSQIRIRIRISKNTWDWTTHILPQPDQN